MAGRAPTVAAKGTEGKYPFPVAPRTALERLNHAYPAESPKIHDEEWQVLDAAWQFRTAAAGKEPSLELIVDAMLTASGLQTDAERAVYRDKVRRLTAEAREAVKNRQPSTHAGDALLAFLHAGVMKKGYDEHQTSITDVFDTGKYKEWIEVDAV